MSVWYYMKDGQQYGPVELIELKTLAADGGLLPTDMIWKEGLADWVQASRTKGLFPGSAATGAPVAYHAPATAGSASGSYAVASPRAAQVAEPAMARPATAVETVGYYAAASGLPARAANVLRHLPAPSGSTQDWPLDDNRLRQLKAAGQLRRLLIVLAFYFRLMFAAGAIMCTFVLVSLMIVGSTTRSSSFIEPQAWIPLILMFGSTIAAAFCYRATERAQSWAPFTMLAVHIALTLYWCYGLYQIISSVGLIGPAFAAIIIPMLLCIVWLMLGAFFCYRATVVIPQFLAQPVWCQEALVSSHF